LFLLPIIDWENARSRRDYNAYTFSYDPIEGYVSEGRLIHGVKMEVSLASLSFPTVELPVESYVYQYLMKENEDIVDEYDLHPFTMKVQDIDRTLADKVFAICDYYIDGSVYKGGKLLLLIVDDSELNRELLAGMLGDEYEIYQVENGKMIPVRPFARYR